MNSKPETMYRCSICHKVSTDKDIADKCCQPGKCKKCGKELKLYYHTICDQCAEKERYEKAEKIKYSDYKIEYLYDPIYDEYFRDEDELFESHELNEDENKPTWAWGCKEIPFKINIRSMIESAEEEMYDDFDDIVDEKELIEFVEKWNEKQVGKSYFPDYKTVILLDQ